MDKFSIPIYYIERKTIKGFKNLDEFIDNVKSGEIYLVDQPTFKGRDINFKILTRLSALYGVWYDFNSRWIDDVSDAIISGAKIVVISGKKVNISFVTDALSITENVALKSNDENLISKFRELGGKYLISDHIVDGMEVYRIEEGRLVQL
ncbi:MAG: hypothetical protein ACP5F1_01395 [Thermoplasmata archaeon]|nr:hypothetical protein [Thermoplasmata archaeon]